jgi:hypothetical protein
MAFKCDELVMYKENGKIYSAGFTVNSVMLQHGISPITRGGGGAGVSKTGGTGDSVMHETFNNLAIPAGLYYFDGIQQGGSSKSEKYINEPEAVSDAIYSTLVGLAEEVGSEFIGGSEGGKEDQGKHKKTKKHRFLQEQKKRKTRKQ